MTVGRAMPDAAEAPAARDLVPEHPPDDALTGEPTARKTAVKAPIPAHGEVASAEQLAGGERATEESDRSEE